MSLDTANKLHLVTLRKQPQYLLDNVLKYTYNTSNNTIVFATCKTDFYKFSSINPQYDYFNKFNSRTGDLYVLIFDNTKSEQIKKYINKYYKTLLPLYCVVTSDYLIVTNATNRQINEISTQCNAYSMGGLYLKEMGGILTTKLDIKIDYKYKGSKYPQIYQVHKANYIHLSPHLYGSPMIHLWYILRYLIKYHKNKELNIAELGAYFGRNTIEMLKAAKSHKIINIYSFDKFLNICQIDNKLNRSTPISKFLLNVPQYETFCRNVSDHIDENRHVFTVKIDVSRSIEMLRKYFIIADIVFLDIVKVANQLKSFLLMLFKYAPNVILVGYNCTDKKVKEGVRQFHSKHKHLHLFTTADCYILSAMPIDAARIDAYIKKELQNNYMENLVYTLFACKYADIINMLKKKPVDINMPIDFCNNNTFYTLVVIEIYSKKNKAAVALQKYILQNIDPAPKKIENALFLTYQDYINEYNRGTPIVF